MAITEVTVERPSASRKKACPVCMRQANCHHSPPTQLRHMLMVSRRHGIVFEQAWEAAWVRVRWPHDTEHRRDFKKVLKEQRVDWAAAYERRGEVNRRLIALAMLLNREDAAEAA